MDVCSYVDKFKYQGFVDIGSSLLSSEEINRLSDLVKNRFDTISHLHSNYKDNGMECILNLLEEIPPIGATLNKIVSNPTIMEFLEEILGKNYKIWDVSARLASSGDKGLYLHQDGPGQVNLFLSLDDNLYGDGASLFLPSSHLIKTSQKKLRVEVPPALLRFLPFLFERLSGLKGNIDIFSNRTWHGRWKNASSCDHTVIAVGFFPAGYSYGAGMPAELISNYSGTRLGPLLAGPSDLPGTISSTCEYRESGAIKYSDEQAFSLNIENHEFLSRLRKPPKLILSLIAIRFLMFFVVIARLFRKIIEKLK
jgi:putative 2OG-Fe(II) oxygenase